jgi:hypothetical protein
MMQRQLTIGLNPMSGLALTIRRAFGPLGRRFALGGAPVFVAVVSHPELPTVLSGIGR